ncbi:MAG: tRNA-specific adenosine deaminase subunit tad3 [Alyxoria varia]|nr:MAG: tRNA-specific adenosine deaminase subunit tad3 [Alyxoria varia]
MTSDDGAELSTSRHASTCPLLQVEDLSTASLRPLKTTAEVKARDKTIEVFICRIPAQSAGKLFNLRKAIPNQELPSLQHLKRFAKSPFLPEPLQDRLANSTEGSKSFYALLAPIAVISKESLNQLLAEHDLLEDGEAPSTFTLPVPEYPPASSVQARAYSLKYWPTNFTNNNPFGPHPNLIARTKQDLVGSAGQWMALARRVGREAHESLRGLGIGTVIVERQPDGTEAAVVVAGDARYMDLDKKKSQDRGTGEWAISESRPMPTSGSYAHHNNPAAHSILRAADLVAQKRRLMASTSNDKSDAGPCVLSSPKSSISLGHSSALHDLTSSETHFFHDKCEHTCHSMTPGGYLCLDLVVYTTHEPCICCAMALVHSRIGACVFETGMLDTGGFGVYESGVLQSGGSEDGHEEEAVPMKDQQHKLGSEVNMTSNLSLFWRQDLNWRFTAWKWEGKHLHEHTGSSPDRWKLFAALPKGTHV